MASVTDFLSNVIGIGTEVAVKLWNDLVKWLKDFLESIRQLLEKIRQTFSQLQTAAKMFMQKVKIAGVFFRELKHKLFYKDSKGWVEVTTIRRIKEDEVPADVKKKLNNRSMVEAELSEAMLADLCHA